MLEIEQRKNLLGTKIIGRDGFSEYNGVVEELSIINHSILGNVKKVLVRWLDGCKAGTLEPYSLNQFKEYEGQRGIGVYYQM